jgi:hypothetical protein
MKEINHEEMATHILKLTQAKSTEDRFKVYSDGAGTMLIFKAYLDLKAKYDNSQQTVI